MKYNRAQFVVPCLTTPLLNPPLTGREKHAFAELNALSVPEWRAPPPSLSGSRATPLQGPLVQASAILMLRDIPSAAESQCTPAHNALSRLQLLLCSSCLQTPGAL